MLDLYKALKYVCISFRYQSQNKINSKKVFFKVRVQKTKQVDHFKQSTFTTAPKN